MITRSLQAGLTGNFRPTSLVLAIALIGFLTLPAFAQQMPREDVVDVPAIREGLCVSNVFQSNMVLQRDKPIHVWGRGTGADLTVSFAGGEASDTAGASHTNDHRFASFQHILGFCNHAVISR